MQTVRLMVLVLFIVRRMGKPKQWSFDHYVTTKYGCLDMAYDPSIRRPTSKIKDLLWFYHVGISGKDEITVYKWSVKTFETILRENNHVDRIIDILKIDVECSEWSAFDAMLAKPSCLANVKQLMVEFHPCNLTSSSAEEYVYMWRILREIDRLGFKMWRTWNNCLIKTELFVDKLYACFNAYYINVNFIV